MDSDTSLQKATHIAPFQVRSALVGLAMDEIDQSIIEYVNYLSHIIPIARLRFAHFVPELAFHASQYDAYELGLLEQEERIAKIRKEIDLFLKRFSDSARITNWDVQVEVGNALHAMLETGNEIDVDLDIIGKSTKHQRHGISGRRLARQSKANVLIIPDRAIQRLDHLLVPFDFSDNSKRALRTAIALQQQRPEETSITCLAIFEVPPINWYRIQRTEDQMADMLREDRYEAFEKFMQEEFPDYTSNVYFVAEQQTHAKVGVQIMEYALKKAADFIIMGAKGHTGIDRFLLGSVTEKVISMTEEMPVLVIR